MNQNDDAVQHAKHQPGNRRDIKHAAVIPVIEEQFRVDKKRVKTGTVRISKHVTEREETVSVPLVHEDIQVERVAINQFIDAPPPAIRYEGDTMIIPVIQEVAVVEKRLMLVEELHVIKRQSPRQETQTVNLRKEEVSVEQTNAGRSDHATEENGS